MPDSNQIWEEWKEPNNIAGVIGATNLEDYWVRLVGPTLYGKFVRDYTEKMWGVSCREIDDFAWSPKGVALKSGPRAAWDDAISAYPLAPDGYNRYFDVTTAPRVLGITAQTDNPVGDLRHIPALRWRYEARLKKHLNHNPKKESNPQEHCA